MEYRFRRLVSESLAQFICDAVNIVSLASQTKTRSDARFGRLRKLFVPADPQFRSIGVRFFLGAKLSQSLLSWPGWVGLCCNKFQFPDS